MKTALELHWYLAIALAIIMASCSGPASARLEQSQQRWKSQNIVDYRYTLRMQCYCPLQYLGPNLIEVRHGASSSISYSGDSKNIDLSGVILPDTVDKLFDIIRAAPEDITVTYDPTLGYPTSIHTIDRAVSHDNFTIYSVTDFEVIR